MKNKNKTITKSLFENLEYKNCSIKLDNVEIQYLLDLSSKIYETKNNLSQKDIEFALLSLCDRNEVRYFTEVHIKEIAKNLKKKFLNEELGRNKHTIDTNGIPVETLLFKKGIDISNGIDAHTGKHTVKIKIDKTSKIKYFNSEAEADLYIKNLYKNFVN